MLNIKLTNAMNMSNWHDWHGISKTTKTQWNDPIAPLLCQVLFKVPFTHRKSRLVIKCIIACLIYLWYIEDP